MREPLLKQEWQWSSLLLSSTNAFLWRIATIYVHSNFSIWPNFLPLHEHRSGCWDSLWPIDQWMDHAWPSLSISHYLCCARPFELWPSLSPYERPSQPVSIPYLPVVDISLSMQYLIFRRGVMVLCRNGTSFHNRCLEYGYHHQEKEKKKKKKKI